MRRTILTVFTAVSLLLCVASGWCWKRSYGLADIISRDSLGDGRGTGNSMSGIGSYRGAMLIGSLKLPGFHMPCFEVNRRVFTVEQNQEKLKSAVAARRGMLGFGVADGTIQLPMFGSMFKTPPMPYHVVYIPYYFIMLVTAILPMWRTVLFLRRVRVPACPMRTEPLAA